MGFNPAQLAAIEAEKKKQSQINRTQEAGIERNEITKDFRAGAALGNEIVGEGIGRLEGNAQIENTREQLRGLTEGPTSAENTARREGALENINAQTQSSSRQLLGQLNTAGVKGGVAAAQLAATNNQGILARRSLERDITADQSAQSRSAVNNLADFETTTTKFDLDQEAKEKNILLQTQLTTAQLGTTGRATLRATEAQLSAAEKSGGSGGKK